MNISEKGLDLIKKWEGCKLQAYQDPTGTYTIGWGNTFYPSGEKVKKGDYISQKEADRLLFYIVGDFARQVNDRIKYMTFNQNQFDALVSFTYNLGAKNLERILTNIAEDRWVSFSKARVGGRLTTLKGLVARREEEWALFSSPILEVKNNTEDMNTEKIKNALMSKTVWSIVLAFIIGGLGAIEPLVGADASMIISGILGIIGIYGRMNPVQDF